MLRDDSVPCGTELLQSVMNRTGGDCVWYTLVPSNARDTETEFRNLGYFPVTRYSATCLFSTHIPITLSMDRLQMQSLMWRLLRQENGQDLIEYALIAGLVTVSTAALLPSIFQDSISHIYSRVSSCMHTLGGL